MAEKLTKAEELERATKALDINQHKLNVVLKRIPELKSEIQDAIVRQETRGYAANTIKRLKDELNNLQSQKDSLEFDIIALQAKIPELKKQAMFERLATEGVGEYEKAKQDFITILNEKHSLDAVKTFVDGILTYADKLHKAKTMFLLKSKNLFDFIESNRLDSVGSITQKQLYSDRAEVNFSEILNLCNELEKISDMLTETRFSLYAATENPVDYIIPQPIDPDTVEQISSCGKFKRKKEGDIWKMFYCTANEISHQYWQRIYEGKDKIAFPTARKENGDWVIVPEK